MTVKEFKKVAQLLKKAYKELEEEFLRADMSLLSDEFDQARDKIREKVLEDGGFTLEEYVKAKDKVQGITKAGAVEILEDTREIMKTAEELSNEARESISKYNENLEKIGSEISEIKSIIPSQEQI